MLVWPRGAAEGSGEPEKVLPSPRPKPEVGRAAPPSVKPDEVLAKQPAPQEGQAAPVQAVCADLDLEVGGRLFQQG